MGRVRVIVGLVIVLVFAGGVWARADRASVEAGKYLPDQIGNFKASGAPISVGSSDELPQVFNEGAVARTYVSNSGARYLLWVQSATNDAAAFARLTHARWIFNQKLTFDDVGTASFTNDAGSYKGDVFFYKGNVFAGVTGDVRAPIKPTSAIDSVDEAKELARDLAAQLDAGEGEIPVLVKHLPNAETTDNKFIYAVSLEELEEAVESIRKQRPDLIKQAKPGSDPVRQPVLDVLDFAGGTEAVAASYGPSLLVIVEFTTPQMSIDNDSRIWTKIAELKSQGQPGPTAYRRVGNYSVFVFNAPDEKTANALIDQVKYEQVVQWLGDDPHLYDRLQKYLTQTSAGVLIAVLKSSGLSLVICLAVGGLIGALLFRHRRAQRAAAFSDAGGSIRLNLDELSGPANTRRLLPTSNKSQDDRS